MILSRQPAGKAEHEPDVGSLRSRIRRAPWETCPGVVITTVEGLLSASTLPRHFNAVAPSHSARGLGRPRRRLQRLAARFLGWLICVAVHLSAGIDFERLPRCQTGNSQQQTTENEAQTKSQSSHESSRAPRETFLRSYSECHVL